MKALDQWRASAGVVYERERSETAAPPVHGRPLARQPGHLMKYGKVAGLDKPVSRLVMGVDNQTQIAHAAVMFDDYFERGGNCFDTAHGYGQGLCEKTLGAWVRNRGVRDDVVILGKGAHTPFCEPKFITSQLIESLERMGLERVDIYMMHRDNLDVPVGEFIDVLNEHKRAGRIGVFGGSNWTLARIDEANVYAVSKGLSGFSALSNNFALARMVQAVWKGCISVSDPASRGWLERAQMALMPWSSQARGFFTDRARPDDHSDRSLSQSWYSEDNFQRKARAKELAARLGVTEIQIALAYVLCQPFPTFPLIGPRTLEETRVSFGALEIALTPEQVRWLNLED
jgi:aryl-alcohol dehydrogenase-like predicted oxidoreductase